MGSCCFCCCVWCYLVLFLHDDVQRDREQNREKDHTLREKPSGVGENEAKECYIGSLSLSLSSSLSLIYFLFSSLHFFLHFFLSFLISPPTVSPPPLLFFALIDFFYRLFYSCSFSMVKLASRQPIDGCTGWNVFKFEVRWQFFCSYGCFSSCSLCLSQ